jgi:hypothetical protein
MSVGVTQHWASPLPATAPRQRAEDRLAVPVLLTPPDDSVGTEPGAVAHWLLRTADQAMYTAKTSGKARAVLSGTPTGEEVREPGLAAPVDIVERPL